MKYLTLKITIAFLLLVGCATLPPPSPKMYCGEIAEICGEEAVAVGKDVEVDVGMLRKFKNGKLLYFESHAQARVLEDGKWKYKTIIDGECVSVRFTKDLQFNTDKVYSYEDFLIFCKKHCVR